MGGHLEVKLLIDEMFMIPFRMADKRRSGPQSATEVSMSYYRADYDPIMITHGTTKYPDTEQLILQDDWVEKVIKPLGMGDRLIIEIPCKLPNIPEGALNPDLEDLKEKLEKGMKELKDAIDEYNRGKDAEKCILGIREAGDHLYEIQNNRTYKINFDIGKPRDVERLHLYSKYLIEDTDTGSEEISNEIMTGIQIIINQIYDMASKVPHTRTRKREAFEYEPSCEDADLMLGITSLIFYWMSTKFSKSMMDE